MSRDVVNFALDHVEDLERRASIVCVRSRNLPTVSFCHKVTVFLSIATTPLGKVLISTLQLVENLLARAAR